MADNIERKFYEYLEKRKNGINYILKEYAKEPAKKTVKAILDMEINLIDIFQKERK